MYAQRSMLVNMLCTSGTIKYKAPACALQDAYMYKCKSFCSVIITLVNKEPLDHKNIIADNFIALAVPSNNKCSQTHTLVVFAFVLLFILATCIAMYVVSLGAKPLNYDSCTSHLKICS